MGREATCMCMIQGRQAPAKVLLEQNEVIIRGELRRVISVSAIKDLRVEADTLTFVTGTDKVSLLLGSTTAKKWLDAILKPPATLAQKLGIGPDSVVQVCGLVRSDELRTALAQAGDARGEPPNMFVTCVESRESLVETLEDSREFLERGIPIWVVYQKGTGSPLGETAVRDTLRQRGLRDTKVASVSSTLTALRFSKPAAV
jgi:hypothetical protein